MRLSNAAPPVANTAPVSIVMNDCAIVEIPCGHATYSWIATMMACIWKTEVTPLRIVWLAGRRTTGLTAVAAAAGLTISSTAGLNPPTMKAFRVPGITSTTI